MGTQIRLVFYAVNKQEADSVSDLVFERIDGLNNILSDYIEDSELNKLTNEAPASDAPNPKILPSSSKAPNGLVFQFGEGLTVSR